MIYFVRHSGASRNPDICSGSAGRWRGWIATFVGITLILLAAPVMADDDLSSTIRTAPAPAGLSSMQRTTQPTGLSSTIRAKPTPTSSVDPMLDTTAPNPKDSITTDDMTSSDPSLSTTQSAPQGSANLSQPESAKKNAKASLDPRLCDALVKHTPSADVAYQPGVDASGKAVAPADLPGQPQMKLPDKINVPLTANLAQTLHLDTSKYPYNTLGAGTEAWLGTLSVEGDKVSFNGQPLSDQQQDNLAVLCMKQKR